MASYNSPGFVSKIQASTGASPSSDTIVVGNNPLGLAFDGTNIWVANLGSDNVMKLQGTQSGEPVAIIDTFAVGTSPAYTAALVRDPHVGPVKGYA